MATGNMLLLAFAGLALMIGRAPRAATPTTSRATTVSAKYLDEPLLVPGAVAADPEKLDFFSQWYPLSSTRTLARGKPNALRLLDVPLVAWKAGNGWRVAEDRCPHRGAPLSYGRLEVNSTLSCSYHGWQFGDSESDAPSYVPTGGCGARLRNHPSQVCEHGLLWVWPKPAAIGSVEAFEAYAKPLPVDHLPAPDCVVTDWTVNRVPIPWASLLENTLDDAHGVHAHHGLAGLDRALARPASQTRSGESGAGESFAAWVNVSGPLIASDLAGRVDADSVESTWVNSYRFLAPHRTTVRFGPAYRAEGFLVPTAADETLLVSAAFSVPGPGLGGNLLPAAPRATPARTAPRPRPGVTIVCQAELLAEADGLDDLRGERWTGERTSGGLTASDGAVVRLRKWLRRSGGPPLKPTEKSDVRRWRARHKISVWEMHTRDCPTCRRAHDDAEATAKVLLVAAAAAAASGELAAAVTLLMTSELSRRTALWFETEDVKFDR